MKKIKTNDLGWDWDQCQFLANVLKTVADFILLTALGILLKDIITDTNPGDTSLLACLIGLGVGASLYYLVFHYLISENRFHYLIRED